MDTCDGSNMSGGGAGKDEAGGSWSLDNTGLYRPQRTLAFL